MKTDRQIKIEATKKEENRVFENFCLPARDIYAECSDGIWIKRVWQNLRSFGWDKWEKC